MAGGLWIHRIDRAGGPQAVISAAQRTGADRIIVKTRDGRGPYNKNDAPQLATLAAAAGIPLYVWGWFYAADEHGSLGYIDLQAIGITDDAKRFSAAGICLNLEAAFSWGFGHRWASRYTDLFGQKAARKRAIRERTRELLLSVRAGAADRQIAVSTFPIPSSHALAFDLMARAADEIWPQCYFRSMGWQKKIKKSLRQWRDLDAKAIRFTGPGWRGPAKMRAMVAAARSELGDGAPVDLWALDKMDPDEITAAEGIFAAPAEDGGECVC